MLTWRKRGRLYHVRGTLRVGQETIHVAEHSTGLDREADVRAYVTKITQEIRQDALAGRPGRARRLTFADVGRAYLERPDGLGKMDVWRIGELNDVIGAYQVANMAEAWAEFRRERCQGLAPATVERFRATLQAALNYAAEELRYDPPRIKPVRFDNQRIRWLPLDQADRLVASYAPHVRPIVRMYRFQGCRTQEALQLLWPNVDLHRETAYFARTKSSEPRTIKLHPVVAADLKAIWKERNRPEQGHVFLNVRGKPYADTRDYKYPGGNPLRKAHATAIKNAKIRPNGGADFTVHDWRHHWASWCVMEGIDLETIKRMGGWKSLRMVERYAAVSTEHMAAAVLKLR